MAALAVLTGSIDPTLTGAILTFIAPAADGCGMSCSYCLIAQRSEQVLTSELTPGDYAQFIRQTASVRKIAAVTLQGFEPLAPSSLPWTKAVLQAANEIGCETGLVTNGLHLAENARMLADLKCGGITVSIDADNEAEHDRLRRHRGAWRAVMRGIEYTVKEHPQALLVAHSVMIPGRKNHLAGLPQVLADTYVKKWAVTPLIKFRGDGIAMTHGNTSEVRARLADLAALAAANGIEFCTDDEFSLLREIFTHAGDQEDFIQTMTVRTLSRPDGLLRFTPDGHCAFGLDILRTHKPATRAWTPNTDIRAFLDGRLPGTSLN